MKGCMVMGAFLGVYSGLSYDMSDEIGARVRDALHCLVKQGRPIKKGDSVAIKVSIPIPLGPERAASTHPEILKAVIRELQSIGARVTVYEDCYNDTAPYVSGIFDAALETGTEFVNLNGKRTRDVKVKERTYKYYEDILNADHLVSLPKLKTHVLTNYTGAVKLMYGSIIKEQRKLLHKYSLIEDFSEVLVDIYSIKQPTLVVMDAIVSMEGSGPTHGTPKNTGLLLTSNDGVLLDYYAASIMKYNPIDIVTNRIALERGLNNCGIEEVEMLGEHPDNININFQLVAVLKGAMKKRFMELSRGYLSINEEKCTKCGVCVKSCPFEAIAFEQGPVINRQHCQFCYCCLELCPSNAVVSTRRF